MKCNVIPFLNEYRRYYSKALTGGKIAEENEFFNKYKNTTIPDYLVWGLKIRSGKLEYLGMEGNKDYTDMELEKLLSYIRPSFRCYFKDVFEAVFSITGDMLDEEKDFYIKTLLPLQLEKDNILSVISIIPFTSRHVVRGIVFIVNPLVKYNKIPFSIEVVSNGQKDKLLTKLFKNHIRTVSVAFTENQNQIAPLIKKGMDINEISKATGKTTFSIYKINKRILEKLSMHYSLKFNDVKEAVNFHYKCFQ